MERIDEYRFARRVVMAEVSEGRVLGSSSLGCGLGHQRMTVEAVQQSRTIGRSGDP